MELTWYEVEVDERPPGVEKVPWANVSSMEALVEEVTGLWRAMERQFELLLELVKLWQGNPAKEPEREPGEIPENGPGVEMYCESLALN